MPPPASAGYLVRHAGDEAQIKVVGRAMHLNCRPIGGFLRLALDRGVRHLFVDFAECQGMDSTFMGMLASSALEAQRRRPQAEVVLTRLSPHNRKLISNLGIDRLVEIREDPPAAINEASEPLENGHSDRQDILAAHESLLETSDANRPKFESVISFLRKEIDGGEGGVLDG